MAVWLMIFRGHSNSYHNHYNRGPQRRVVYPTVVEPPKEFVICADPEFLDPAQPKFRLKIEQER